MVIISIIVLILMLGVLVLLHETGHFLVARAFGVHVYEFSVGMGPLVFKHKAKSGIQYSIRALPIGGYVQLAGEVAEDDNKIPKDKFMCNKPWWQRILILSAGVIMNFITAFVLLFLIGIVFGSTSTTPKIAKVMEESSFAEAGGHDGDVILSVDGKTTKTWDRAQVLLTLDNKKEYYEIKVRHEDNTEETLKVAPKETTDENGNITIDLTAEEAASGTSTTTLIVSFSRVVKEGVKPCTNEIYKKALDGHYSLKNPTQHLLDYLSIQNVFLDKDTFHIGNNKEYDGDIEADLKKYHEEEAAAGNVNAPASSTNNLNSQTTSTQTSNVTNQNTNTASQVTSNQNTGVPEATLNNATNQVKQDQVAGQPNNLNGVGVANNTNLNNNLKEIQPNPANLNNNPTNFGNGISNQTVASNPASQISNPNTSFNGSSLSKNGTTSSNPSSEEEVL